METMTEYPGSLGVVISADDRRRWPDDAKARVTALSLTTES